MRFSSAALRGQGGAITLVVALAFACSRSLAEQPPWEWTGRGSPASRGSNRRPSNAADAWYSGEDKWTPVDNAQGEQYPAYGDQDYGYGSAAPHYPAAQEWGADEEEGRGGQAKAKQRGGKRRRAWDGGGRGGDFDEFDNGNEGGSTDLVEEYTETFKGRLVLSGGASFSGAVLGAIISKSTIHRTPVMSLVGLLVGLILSVAKGAFGDLFRASGLAAVLALRRSRSLSAEYPFLPYARRALVMLPRRPFPPAENPWKYKRADALAELEEAGVADDGNLPAEFSMAKSLLAVAFLGGFAGYVVSQFLLFPTFLLALGGGGMLSYLATSKNARGDLTRLLGMRMVAFLGLMSEINSDVALSRKAKVVGGICFSKAMFWDSKYHIKDRIVVLLSNLYVAVTALVRKVQRDAGDGEDSEETDTGGEDDSFSEEGIRQQQQPRRRRRRRRSLPDDDNGLAMPASRPPPPPGFGTGGGGYQGDADRYY